MDEERYEAEKKMYKNFKERKEDSNSGDDEEEEDESNMKTSNYRLMAEDEIPSWFVEAVPMVLFSPKQQKSSRNTAEATESASRSTTATT